MMFTFTPDELAFRDDVRAFIRREVSPEIATKVRTGRALTRDEFIAWQRKLNDRGWLAPRWPVEYGGTNWSPVQHHIFSEELALGFAPRPILIGAVMLAPVLIKYGSAEQRAYYLPRILTSEDWWCQGYSEPGAGSDLAAVETRAIRDGDWYVVNGTKTWTSYAQYSNMIFCLVRTDPSAPKRRGLSFLLIDMATPGITVRPIPSIDGRADLNEVNFTDVRVPAANLIGEAGQGWTYAKFLLEAERSGLADIGFSSRLIEELKAFARNQRVGAATLLDDVRFAERVADVEVSLTALSSLAMRVLADGGSGMSGVAPSIMKLVGTDVQQSISELMMDAAGYGALDPATYSALRYFEFRKKSIYAGSNEIQRNIIARQMLGL